MNNSAVDPTDTQSVIGVMAEPAYFDEVIMQMQKQGFVPFSRVTITNDDFPYHVPVNRARDTSLFFHLPGRALIIQMSYGENDFHHQYRSEKDEGHSIGGIWGIRLYFERLSYKHILSRVSHLDMEEWDDAISNLPLYSKIVEIPGFKWYGNGKYMQPYYTQEKKDPKSLAENIVDAIYSGADYIAGGKLDELQVTSFPPIYVFPNCEEVFWERFERSALRKLANRPWGSSGLKR